MSPLRKLNCKDQCIAWLRKRLEDGPIRSDQLREEAMKEHGWSATTVLRAAHELNLVSDSRADNFMRRTWWSLPEGDES